jgi:hypothetical protein
MAFSKRVDKSPVWCYIHVIPGTWKTEARDFHFRARLGNRDLISKTNKQK